MFDTMTITKAAGGFLSAWLVLLLGMWAADGIYSTEPHHDEEHVAGYSIEIPEEAPVDAEPEDVVPFAEFYANADASAGEGLWRACASCHSQDAGGGGVGPYLHGLVNRDIAGVEGFGYSDALVALEGDWTPEALSGFLESPRDYAPGTAMSYRGMSDPQDRADLIAFIDTFDD